MSAEKARAVVMDHLLSALAIPLLPELCTLMVRVGFDESLLSYGDVDGIRMGYADGFPLMKFVGFLDEDEQMVQDAQQNTPPESNPTLH